MARIRFGWRALVVVAYVGWMLVCVLVFGGGLPLLLFFAAWGAMWLVFSGFWRWADEARRALLHRHGLD